MDKELFRLLEKFGPWGLLLMAIIYFLLHCSIDIKYNPNPNQPFNKTVEIVK